MRFRSFLALPPILAVVVSAVEPGLPSKTSIYTATCRAIGAKNPDRELRNPDYLAIKFLGPRERAALNDYPMDALDLDFDAALKRLPIPALVTGMVLRTRFFDDVLEDSVRDGAKQVVVLGAGFDSRAYRFDRLRNVRFFEVDYPPTQEYKKLRVQEILGKAPEHLRYVPVDFTKDDLLAELRKSGYSEKDKTLFIWEGVVYYLPESAVKATFQFVRDHAGTGSRIGFDYKLSSHSYFLNQPERFVRWGERQIFGFPGESATAFVRKEGLDVISDVPEAALVKYTRRKDGTSSLPTPRDGAGVGYCVARVPEKASR